MENNGSEVTVNYTTGKSVLDNSEVYDILLQGIRDRFLNPGSKISLMINSVSEIDLNASTTQYHKLLFANVYDSIAYAQYKSARALQPHSQSDDTSLTH